MMRTLPPAGRCFSGLRRRRAGGAEADMLRRPRESQICIASCIIYVSINREKKLCGAYPS